MISASNSLVTAVTNPAVAANGQSVVAVRISLRDETGAPYATPTTVSVTADSENVIIQQPAATNLDGVTYTYVASFTPGVYTLTATAQPAGEAAVIIDDTESVNFLQVELPGDNPDFPRSVRLTWSTSRFLVNNADAIRVRIEAVDSISMPTAIFAYRLLPMTPTAVEQSGVFDHVCSAVDLEEYPETEPLAGSEPPWFRLSYVDLLLRTREEANDVINGIVADVDSLRNTLNNTETLENAGDIWLGPGPVIGA